MHNLLSFHLFSGLGDKSKINEIIIHADNLFLLMLPDSNLPVGTGKPNDLDERAKSVGNRIGLLGYLTLEFYVFSRLPNDTLPATKESFMQPIQSKKVMTTDTPIRIKPELSIEGLQSNGRHLLYATFFRVFKVSMISV